MGTRIAQRNVATNLMEDASMLSTCDHPADTAQDFALHLERLVQGRAGSRIRDLRVEVRADEVVLTGRAYSYYAKQLATHAALCAVAPRALTNAIDVM